MNPGSPRARAPLRSQLRAAVAETILDATEAVVAERGLTHASLAAIAARAGVAVGTLYNYHRDRDDLVRSLFASRRARIVPELQAAVAADPDARFAARLRAYVVAVMAVFDRHRRFVKVAAEAEHLRPPSGKGGRAPRPVLVAMIDGLTAILDVGVTEGAIPAARRDLYARLLAGMLKAAVLLRLDTGDPLDHDAEVLVDTFLHGVVAGGRPG